MTVGFSKGNTDVFAGEQAALVFAARSVAEYRRLYDEKHGGDPRSD